MQPAGGGVVLNFEGADLREVVRNILGDILNENYTIDPAVGGTVTIRTSTGIPRDALPATLETLLRMNGATMVKNGGLYQVVPQAVAVRGNTVPQLGNSTRSLPPGFSVQIVPLHYVGVKEMMRLLEPFAKDAQAVRPDELRNLLILAGTERELQEPDGHDRHVRHRLDGGHVGGRVHADQLGREVGDGRTGQDHRRQELESLGRHPAHHPHRADERAARHHAAAVVPGRGEEVDRPPGQDAAATAADCSSTSSTCPNQRAEKLGPLLQQAFTGRVVATDGGVGAHRRARHAGRHRSSIRRRSRRSTRRPAVQHADAAAGCSRRRPQRRPAQRQRHRAQPAGRRRQGQQHAAHHRHRRPSTR